MEPVRIDAEGEGQSLRLVIWSPDAFQRNLERQRAYIRALEAAPWWEGEPPPPRVP